jgi:predicted transcriptional regulator
MPVEQGMDRPDFYVLARILERLWREGGPMLKTRLQVATNVNYDLLMKYLAWLRSRGFIALEEDDGHEVVALTPEGEQAYLKLVRLMNEVIRPQG